MHPDAFTKRGWLALRKTLIEFAICAVLGILIAIIAAIIYMF